MRQHTDDFGPGGYLPERAAKRARKIVLREQMGLGWPLAALAAALLVGVAGLAFLLTGNRAPGAPYVRVAPLHAVPHNAAVRFDGAPASAGREPPAILVVRAPGPLRAFVAPRQALVYCPASRRLESPEGAVFERTGRLVGGTGESLQPLRVTVHDGVVYVDPHPAVAPPPPRPGTVAPTCLPAP